MKWLSVSEHGIIPITRHEAPLEGELSREEAARLGAADRWRERAEPVFRWGAHSVQARQWVGVLQARGIAIEILPKIASARENLLYMLSVSGKLPLRERDLADLATRPVPFSATLLLRFAHRLEEELQDGAEHSYQEEDEELPFLRGRLLPQQFSRLYGRLDRFATRHARFCADTPLNRILKAAARIAHDAAPAARPSLQRTIDLLEEVQDIPPDRLQPDLVPLHRQNARFHTLYRLACLILTGHSSDQRAGDTRTFSLLYDMNRLFEQFIAAVIARDVLPSLPGLSLRIHGTTPPTCLLSRNGETIQRLEPDLLLLRGDQPVLILDTKWKRRDPARNRPGREDLYQLFAYAHCFHCPRNLLLYPQPEDTPALTAASGEDLDIPSMPGARIALRTVNLERDLRAGRRAFADDLLAMIRHELDTPP